MKKVIALVGLVLAGNVFALGANEKYDFNTGFHPLGARLQNVCYLGGGQLEAKVTIEKCERIWTVDSDDQGDVFPQDYVLTDAEWRAQGSHGRFGAQYTPSCRRLTSRVVTKVIPMVRSACLKWETYIVNDGDGDGDSRRSRCVKRGTKPLPRSQRLDTYLDFGSYSERQNSGSAMYTIPRCN